MRTTDRQVHQHLVLSGVRIAAEDHQVVAAAGVQRWLDLCRVAVCWQQLGVIERAIELTSVHVGARKQFGREVGTFQAVAMRAADAYIDIEAMRLTAKLAAWLLAVGEPAQAEVAAAKWWAAEGGHRCIHAALHLHGGLGNSVEYPLHRHFLWPSSWG